MIIVYKGFNLETKIFKIAKYKDFSQEKNTPDLSKNVNLRNNEGETALSVAYGNDNQEIIKLLKENGAK